MSAAVISKGCVLAECPMMRPHLHVCVDMASLSAVLLLHLSLGGRSWPTAAPA